MSKTKEIIIRITMTAMMTGLIYIATMFLAVPYPLNAGYFNLSDCLILFTTIFIGPIEGMFAGAVGSLLADITSSFAIFVPFTIVAKGLEALAAYIIYRILKNHKHLKYISIFIAPLFMVATYFVAYIILYGINSTITSTPLDLLQGFIGSIVAYVLLKIFLRYPLPFRRNLSTIK